jgi:hypothetical protein
MSSVIPSFLNRIDFWAMLLPGYLIIILGMLLFSPYLIYGPNDNANNATVKNGTISFDIFAAIVFLVAGPAIGFTLSQAVIFFSFLLFYTTKYDFAYAYSLLRTKCDDKTKSELDSIDARITFNSSTGVALMIISLLVIFQPNLHISNPLIKDDDDLKRGIVAFLTILSGILFVTSQYTEVTKVRIPLICKLLKEHNIELPKKCYEEDNNRK